MGQKSSKAKQSWPPFPYGNGAYPPYMPPPGFPMPQHYPPIPGYAPQGYGQGAVIPPTHFNWPPQEDQVHEKRKKKTRKGRSQSEQFAGGFGVGPVTFPQPVVHRPSSRNENPRVIPQPSRKRRQPQNPVTPLNTGAPLANFPAPDRQPTPFIPAAPPQDDSDETSESEDEDTPPPPRRASRRNRRTRSEDYPSIRNNHDDLFHPMRQASMRNPLPPPPKDVYEMTPYKPLLALPRTGPVIPTSGAQNITVTTLPAQAVVPQPAAANPAPTPAPPKKKKGSIFRKFSTKRKNEKPPPPPVPAPAPASASTQGPIQFVFVPTDRKPTPNPPENQQHRASSTIPPEPKPPATPEPSTAPFTASGFSSAGFPSGPVTGGFGVRDEGPITGGADFSRSPPLTPKTPEPRPSSRASRASAHPTTPLRFTQFDSAYSGFMNHSPHRIVYQNQTYPTATHLYEALKYIEQHPELAERIRRAEDVLAVYPLSAEIAPFQRSDWGDVFLQMMELVLTLKFSQHPNLRALLLSTHPRPMSYADTLDTFWGEGPHNTGDNYLGKVLMHVREKIRRDTVLS